MSRHLHIFWVNKKPARYIAFEFVSEVQPPVFQTELITWGTGREYMLPDLALILSARGWLLSDIAVAFEAAEKIARLTFG